MKKIIDEDLNSDVFKALSDIAFDYEVNKDTPVYRPEFEEAEENFNDRFFAGYDPEDYDESLTEAVPRDVMRGYDAAGRVWQEGLHRNRRWVPSR